MIFDAWALMSARAGPRLEAPYLENHLIRHGEGAVQFARQSVDLLLQMLGVHQDLQEDRVTCGSLPPGSASYLDSPW